MSDAEETLHPGRNWRRTPVEERFWPKVDTSGGPNACWPWTASLHGNGYGQFNVSHGHPVNAHRVAWELMDGPIPDGLDVLHSCDNPPCCNPLHLFLGTAKDNAADMVAKGRNRHGDARGMRHPNSKLTDDAVRQIRAAVAVGEPKRAIARRFGVNDRLIYMILDGSAWSHVK